MWYVLIGGNYVPVYKTRRWWVDEFWDKCEFDVEEFAKRNLFFDEIPMD